MIEGGCVVGVGVRNHVTKSINFRVSPPPTTYSSQTPTKQTVLGVASQLTSGVLLWA